MLIYQALKSEFLQHAVTDAIVNKIKAAHEAHGITNNNLSEIRSWQNSLQYMYKVLATNEIPDDAGIAIEYKIPLTSFRIDFIISGYDANDKGSVIIVELKQWSGEKTSRVEGKDGIVKTLLAKGLRETTHPSYQVWSYCQYIADFNQNVQNGDINLLPCAYLHNYDIQYKDEIDNPIYADYVKKAPLYLLGDALKLREFISTYIRKGDRKKNLYEIENGKIKPSKSLQDSVTSMLTGNNEFVLLDSQKIAFENALALIRKSQKDKKRRVLIIEGGPGTGKSVIAVNLLATTIHEGMVAQYVSKNAAPRNVYSAYLRANNKTKDLDHLFRGSGSYTSEPKYQFGALIVDEAHRLNEKSGMFRNLGENQVMEIIRSAYCSVFFLDESQKVDIFDIGTKEEIEKYASAFGAEVHHEVLESQFRCNGSDGYMSWLDDVLGIKATANADGFNLNYEIKIFDDPLEMRNAIEEKNKVANKARIVAGYCWDWLREYKNNPAVFDINIDNKLQMSWNLGNTSTWAIDPNSVKEAGCIHTCQGLEFDYVGVIIGNDMIFREEKVKTDYTKRASTDQSLKGIKSMAKDNPSSAHRIADQIIRNTYRTLMTRGQKGCYIYCCNKELQNYLKKRINNRTA